ncbi:MAG: metallophosphoesterase [Pseudomonadota bacterium]
MNQTKCFFVTDLHGDIVKYNKLFKYIIKKTPEIIFVGGDILPSAFSCLTNNNHKNYDNFINDFLSPQLFILRKKLKKQYPKIYLILGNDDPKINEVHLIEAEKKGLWNYIHFKKTQLYNYNIFGYSYIPPTPFLFKDWEKYDVSQYVDPGCIHPYEGYRSEKIPENIIKHSTISNDLEILTKGDKFINSIFLFHAPPHNTNLDYAALDGKMIDHVQLDVHVGSIAIRRFIENNKPLLTLHGHIHESASITKSWKDKINETHCFSAAHNGKELAIVEFNLDKLDQAKRILI